MSQSVIPQAESRLGRLLRPTRALCRFFLPLQPVSREFGADRGQPLDRYYIEQFLSTYQADIRGDVLEVEESLYMSRNLIPKILEKRVFSPGQ